MASFLDICNAAAEAAKKMGEFDAKYSKKTVQNNKSLLLERARLSCEALRATLREQKEICNQMRHKSEGGITIEDLERLLCEAENRYNNLLQVVSTGEYTIVNMN